VRIGTRAITTPSMLAIALVAFSALFAFGVPFPAVVFGAGFVGLLAGDRLADRARAGDETPLVGRPGVHPSWRRAVHVLVIGLAVWLGPLALIALATGTDAVIANEAIFFSLMSLVTFGGAYAVLAYVNQAAVVRFGWLTSGEMAVGLSLAETTPGPLILVVVFVGFVAAYRNPGDLGPLPAALLGSLVTAWATFVPSFLWIFLGAPSIERLRGNRRLSAALAAITAAVVGVIANLALVFAIGVLFDERSTERFLGNDVVLPVPGSADALAIAVALMAFVAMHRFQVNVVWVVLGSGLVGLLRAVL
jgi:chromate transporter